MFLRSRGSATRPSACMGVLCAMVVASLLVGCGDEEKPVDVPFKAIEPPPPDPAPKPDPAPEPSATASSPTGKYTGPVRPSAGRMSSCCAALSAAAKTKNTANASMYTQAAKVCRGQVSQVRAGKLTVDEALASVRSSLLGSAPGACR